MGLRVSVLLPNSPHNTTHPPSQTASLASRAPRAAMRTSITKTTCERLRAISLVRCTPMGMDNYRPRQATQCASPSQTAPRGRMEHNGRTRATKGLQGGLTTKHS